MTHCQQATIKTRFPFEAFRASRRMAKRKRAAVKRITKRAAHFAGFLAFWAVTLAVAELAFMAVMITLISLS